MHGLRAWISLPDKSFRHFNLFGRQWEGGVRTRKRERADIGVETVRAVESRIAFSHDDPYKDGVTPRARTSAQTATQPGFKNALRMAFAFATVFSTICFRF
jgi:hypothetical protein